MENYPGDSIHLPLIGTKLSPPRYSGPLVSRAQLLESITPNRFRKLTLVHAPAGFGKTTLLVACREKILLSGYVTAWVSLDKDDNDFVPFFTYLTAALQLAHAGICQSTRTLLQVGVVPEKVLVSTLVNELSSIEMPTVLFLDDFHWITNRRILDALTFFLTRLPDKVHLVVASRSKPSLRVAGLRARNQLLEINAASLRFSFQETKSFLNTIMGLELSRKELQSLFNLAEGWIAGLQLVSLSLRGRRDRTAFLNSFPGTIRSISEYMAEDVLARQPESQVDFMMKTSVLSRMNSELATALTGVENSQEILDQLERMNLFLLPLDEERRWFRYHHLFSHFLQERLRQSLPGCVASLHRAACDWFASKGLVEEAVHHALEIPDTRKATELTEQCARALVEQGQMATLLGWIKKLPEKSLKSHPRILLAVSWALTLSARHEEAEEILEEIQEELAGEIRSDSEVIEAEVTAIRATGAALREDVLTAQRLARQCLNKDFHDSWVRRVIGNVRIYCWLRRGELTKARAELLESQTRSSAPASHYADVYSKVFMGMILIAEGRPHEARQQLQEAVSLADHVVGRQAVSAALPAAFLFYLLYEENQLDQAVRLRDTHLDLIDSGCPLVEALVACYIPLVRIKCRAGRMEDALAILNKVEAFGQRQGSWLILFAILNERVRIMVEQNNTRAAARLLAQTRGLYQRQPRNFNGTEIHIHHFDTMAEATVLLAQGQPRKAAEHLERFLKDCETFGEIRLSVAPRIVAALAHEQAGERKTALECMHKALLSAMPENRIRPFIDEGPAVADLLKKLKAAEGAAAPHPNLDRLIAAFPASPEQCNPGLSTETESFPAGSPVDPLSDRELDVLRIMANGFSNREIAQVLTITVDTVKWHLKNIYGKLAVSCRTEAINEARLMGILD